MLQWLAIPLLLVAQLNPIIIKESELDTLAAQAGSEVTLRGFVIEDDDGHWAISSHPPVKSCCRGKIAQQGVWVPIEGSWSHISPEQVVEVKGQLISSSEEHTFRSFKLKSPQLVPRKSRQHWPWIPIASAMAVTLAGIWYWRHRS